MPIPHAPPPHRAYELCTTRKQVYRALSILSAFPLVIMDCEGQALGHTDGVLSLICLGTPVADAAQHVFVFDVPALAPCPRSRGALAAFLARGPIKVVWDGRMDAIELAATFGIPLTNVLDLQVLEVVARLAVLGEQDAEREERLARHQFGHRFVDAHRAHMHGLHVVRGLQNCIEYYHPDLKVEKDPRVVEMHKQGDSRQWLARPLPAQLLRYAATDVRLIAHLLSIFDTLGFFGLSLRALLRWSARYVARQARVARGDPFRPSAVIMLDALVDAAPRRACAHCGMELPLACYEKWTQDKSRGVHKEHCRLCLVAALRAGIEIPSRWIEVPMIRDVRPAAAAPKPIRHPRPHRARRIPDHPH